LGKICIKNLAEDMTQEQLKTLFEPFGTVQNINIKTKEDGKCRGFAFLTFAGVEEANKAIAEMDKKDVSGKELSVAMAEDRSNKGEKGEKGAKGDSQGKGKDEKGGKSKGKGKDNGKGKGAAADTTAQSYSAPYPYGSQASYPYGYNPWMMQAQMTPQMQAAQYAQMQAMVQGMYLQSLAAHTAAGSPKAGGTPPGPIMPQATSNKEYIGTLKSLSTRNGYGFIECSEIKQDYKRDVHVSADLLPADNKEVGTKLKFTIGQNSKGHPQARTCSLATA
jgi:RNA recognition motif-containing protein